MARLLFPALLLGWVTSAAAKPPEVEAVTVADLNRNPGKYENKTVILVGEASGPLLEGSLHFRVSVRDRTGTVLSDKLHHEGVNFVVPKDDKNRLTNGLKDDKFQPVRLTLTLLFRQQKGFWFATISDLELLNQPRPVAPTSPTSSPKSQPIAKAVAPAFVPPPAPSSDNPAAKVDQGQGQADGKGWWFSTLKEVKDHWDLFLFGCMAIAGITTGVLRYLRGKRVTSIQG